MDFIFSSKSSGICPEDKRELHFNSENEFIVKFILAQTHFLSKVSLCIIEHFEAESYVGVDVKSIKDCSHAKSDKAENLDFVIFQK